MRDRPRRVAARLAGATFRHRRRASLAAAGFLSLSVTQLSLTWLVKLWIDGPLRSPAAAGRPWLLPVTIALICLLAAAVFVAHYGLGSLNTFVIRDLRRDLQGRLLQLEVGAAQSRETGDLVARLLQDADVAGRFGGELLRRGLGDALVLLGALAMLLVINRQLFGLIAVVASLGVIGHSLVAAAIRSRSLSAQERLGGLSARFAEQLGGYTTIKGSRTETAEQDRFRARNEAYAATLLRVERWSGFALASIWLVTGFALLGLGFYASRALGSGRLAAGDFLVFCLFGAQIVEPVRRLGELGTLAQRGLAAGERLFEVLDDSRLERVAGAPLPRPVRGEVRFECVRFAYPAGNTVLDGASFEVAARETVAIVSPSGGGKSTIAALLVRFRDAEAGAISLDGHDLGSLRLADVRSAVRVVPQEAFVFAGTLLENVIYGSAGAVPSDVEEAVYRAGLDTWVRSLAGGLRASLAEGGRNLSGGQKQRIALARAIVASPPVLVLDEATSAVDGDTEEQIMARMADWLRQRTVILMSHRLSTVLRVPRALVLEGGRITEEGAPAGLLQRPSRFARIFSDQAAPASATPEAIALRG